MDRREKRRNPTEKPKKTGGKQKNPKLQDENPSCNSNNPTGKKEALFFTLDPGTSAASQGRPSHPLFLPLSPTPPLSSSFLLPSSSVRAEDILQPIHLTRNPHSLLLRNLLLRVLAGWWRRVVRAVVHKSKLFLCAWFYACLLGEGRRRRRSSGS
jgi:hypothetical protein